MACIALLAATLVQSEEVTAPSETKPESDIQEIKAGDNAKEIISKTDFTIVSYYNASDE